MSHFIPPEMNLAALWFADAALPAALKSYQNIDEIVISPEDRKMLRSLRKERLLFFTNHPSQAEPMIAYYIGNVMGARFNYMATRRAFDFLFGVVGRWFQATGAYSIMPGVADRESMRMTRQILSSPSGKLVIFPEGEPMCGENDNLMPFQPGIMKLSFAALTDARKVEPDADIKILPGFIKYVISASKDEARRDLEASLEQIEKKLGLKPGERNLLRRFLFIGRVLLENAEKDYGIAVEDAADFDYRLGRVRHAILDQVAKRMAVKNYDTNADAIQKLRHLTSVVELIEINYPMPDLPRLSPRELSEINRKLILAYDFIVMKRDYLIARPTPERFFEWLARYESIVLGKTPRMLGGEPSHLPRTAHVSFAKPFSLAAYYAAYQKNKNGTVDQLLERLRKDMQGLLDGTIELTSPLVAPGEIGGT